VLQTPLVAGSRYFNALPISSRLFESHQCTLCEALMFALVPSSIKCRPRKPKTKISQQWSS
jgi:hypothetical protein